MPRPSRGLRSHALRSSSVLLALAVLAGAAAAQEPLFTFAQISDSQPQTSLENQRFVDVLRTIAESGQSGALLPTRVDLVLFAGDITWGNTRSEWTAARQKLDAWLTANDIPYLAVPGNHDVNNSDTALYEEFIADSSVWDAGSQAFTGHNGRARTTTWRGLRFIGFNNSNPGWNTISSAELADIGARVAAADAAGENVFLLCHHPHDEKERLPLVNVLPQPSVVGYLHGHSGTPHIVKGLAGIANPNLWDADSNAIYAERGILYFEVFPTELRGYVLELDLAPTALPAPKIIPLVHPLNQAGEPDRGFPDLVHALARPTPTSRAPERKLWHRAGTWWGVLWSDASAAHRIQRLDRATQSWIDTGPTVSTTAARSFDVLAAGDVVSIASNVPTVPAAAGGGSPGQVARFTFDAALGRYTADAGFPVALNDSRSPTLVHARDATGTLWSAWTRSGSVFLNHTLGSDAAWGTPLALASGLGGADTVALVAFSARVGALWSSSTAGTIDFAVHLDGDPEGAWTLATATSQAALVGTAIDLATSGGRVFAAVRAAGGGLNLLERSTGGAWSVHPAASAADGLADPLLLVDQAFGLLRLYATGPTLANQAISGGGALYEKQSPLAAILFPAGRGTPVVQDGTHPSCGFAASTRQPVDAASGLALQGSVAQTTRYWHAFDALTSRAPAPVASFSASPRSGPAPLLVDFTDLSTGSPTHWSWDFGDGTGSEVQEPQHVYATPRTYAVSLRASNGSGEDTLARAAYVEVGVPSPVFTFAPVADARVSEGSPTTNAGTATELRAKTQAGSSFQSFLRFDLTGLAGTVSSVKLRLFCTDPSNGGGSIYPIASNTWSETGITWNNRPPLPASPLGVMGGVTDGFWIEQELGPAAASPGLVSLAIAGGTTNSAFYSSREGANPPQLVVTAAGAGSPPTADFSASPLSGPAPLPVAFTDLSSGATAWSWDFGDGASASERNPVHVYAQPGTYSVLLDVSNAAGLDSRQRLDYVTVAEPPPVSTLTFRPAADARVTESSPTKNYGSETTLRVRSQSGSSVQSFLRFDLTGLTGTVTSARLRLFCTDDGSSGGRLCVASDAWTEAGITWSNKPALPPTSIATLGAVALNQWVELDVTGAVTGPGQLAFALAGGSTNTVLYSSREGVNPPELVIQTGGASPPTADFDAAPLSGPAPLSVSFTDLSSGATAWSWDFGDGTGSSAQHPAHVYTAPGSYSVTLVASNAAGTSTELRTGLITVGEPAPTRTFLPVADARVSEGSPTGNAGINALLRVREAAGGSYHTYLRFDLGTLSGPVTSARLRLFSSDGSDVAGLVFPTSGSWTERGITWDNAPGATGPLITSAGIVATNAWVEFDVTAAVSGPGTVNLLLKSTSTNSCYYSSREGASPPQLVVTTSP